MMIFKWISTVVITGAFPYTDRRPLNPPQPIFLRKLIIWKVFLFLALTLRGLILYGDGG